MARSRSTLQQPTHSFTEPGIYPQGKVSVGNAFSDMALQHISAGGAPQLVDGMGRPIRSDRKVPDGNAHPGGLALPGGYLFVARTTGGDYTFWQTMYDEAMRHGRKDAVDMLNDVYLRGLLQERMLAVSSRKWHLEVPDEKDPWQVHVKDSLTRQMKAVTQMPRIIPSHYWAIWFGRQGVQIEWGKTDVRDDFDAKKDKGKQPTQQQPAPAPAAAQAMMRIDPVLRYLRERMLEDPADRGAEKAYGARLDEMGLPNPDQQFGTGAKKRKALSVLQAWEVQGDKIGHQLDGTPYVLVNSAYTNELRHLDPNASIVNTTVGRALSLRGTWRKRFLLHYQFMEDRDFFLGSMQGDAIHGVGIRSHLFWCDFLKKDFLGRVAEFYDRIGLGVNIWTYPSGNVEALNAAQTAAKNQSDRANLFVPVIPGQERSTTLERLEVPTAGAGEMIKLVEYFDKQMERYVVGQEGSASATSADGHSNKSSSEFQQDTKEAIARQDAAWHAMSMTGDTYNPGMVSIMQEYSFPETISDFPVSFVYDHGSKMDQEKVTSGKTLVDMGIPTRADDMRDAAGFGKPADGDELVQPPQPAGGAPGGGPPGAGGGADPLAALMGGGGGSPSPEGAPGDEQPNGQPGGGGDFLDALRAMREATEALRYAREQDDTVKPDVVVEPPTEAPDSGAVTPSSSAAPSASMRPAVPPFAPVSLRHARLARVVNHLRKCGKGELADEMVLRFAAHHAPAGGVTIGGTFYTGGEFIPGDVMEKATPEEKAKVEQKAQPDDAIAKADAAMARWKELKQSIDSRKADKEKRRSGTEEEKEKRRAERKEARRAFQSAVKEVFGESVSPDSGDDDVIVEEAGRKLGLEFLPQDKAVYIQYTQDASYDVTNKKLQPGTVDLMHKFQTFLGKAAKAGLGIHYGVTEERRRRIYAHALTKAGYEKAPTGGETESEWKPKGEVDPVAEGAGSLSSMMDLMKRTEPTKPAAEPEPDKPSPSRAHSLEAAHFRLDDALNRHAALGETKRQACRATASQVLHALPAKALERFNKGAREYRFYGSCQDLTKGALPPSQLAAFAGKIAGGGYDGSRKRLHLDGDTPRGQPARELYAHEFGHAVDGPEYEISSSPEWQEAYQSEIKPGGLSDYAKTLPREGFAEFFRLVHGTDTDRAEIVKRFPKCSDVFKKWGIFQ
jgi:hypothetical protein